MLILKNGTRLVSPGTMAERPPEALWPGNQQPLITAGNQQLKPEERKYIHLSPHAEKYREWVGMR